MSGWSAALRTAYREACRARGRTALVVVLIALPVTAIVAGDTLRRTADVSVAESLPQRIGAADALLRYNGGGALTQDILAQSFGSTGESPGLGSAPPKPQTTAHVLAELPAGSALLPLAEDEGTLPTPSGSLRLTLQAVDVHSPLTEGLFPLVGGRLPDGGDSVAVSPAVAARGFGIGRPLAVGTRVFQVVGIVRPLEEGSKAAVVLPGTLTTTPPSSWLAKVPGGLSWSQVQTLNSAGVIALSRRVVLFPPPASQVSVQTGSSGAATFAVLVATLALLQVVLLAAPAFAIGARRQRRVLALLAATGAAPRHVRRFVLAQGVVLGSAAAVLGAALGLGVAAAGRSFLPHPGPFEVSGRNVLITTAVGAASALLAALVPALFAGRQDVLAGLTGRRGAAGRSLPSLAVGLVLVGVGIAGGVAAARPSAGTYAPVFSAVPTVVGASLLAPAALVALARICRSTPFPLRFAVRDAARTRGRTAAAVAAVTVTVSAVVALGIGGSSDAAQARVEYVPTSPAGTSLVSQLGETGSVVSAIRQAVEGQLRGVPLQALQGVPSRSLLVSDPAAPPAGSSYYGPTTVLVGESGLALMGLTPDDLAAARRALQQGKVVVPADHPDQTGPVVVTETSATGEPRPGTTLLAFHVKAIVGQAAVQAVLPTTTASRLRYRPQTVALLIPKTLTKDEESRVRESLNAAGNGFLQVERGYRDQSSVVLLVLAGVGAVLVLGGTISAALLALSDARPDFATLMAVGARPAVRRRVAAAYAAVIALLGAVLGCLAGLVPGIAVSFPLTRNQTGLPGAPSSYLDIPWLLLVTVAVVVPAIAAAAAAGLTRSRLPLTARME